MLLKTALRAHIAAQPAVDAGGSVRASALLRRSARDGERKGLLSDTHTV
jgi:hypothetical protein